MVRQHPAFPSGEGAERSEAEEGNLSRQPFGLPPSPKGRAFLFRSIDQGFQRQQGLDIAATA